MSVSREREATARKRVQGMLGERGQPSADVMRAPALRQMPLSGSTAGPSLSHVPPTLHNGKRQPGDISANYGLKLTLSKTAAKKNKR